MAAYVLVDAQIYYNEFNISGLMNQVAVQYNADTPEATVLSGDGTRRRISGLIDVQVNGTGYIDQTDKDEGIYDRIGNSLAGDLSVASENGVVGSRAYFLRVHQGTYNILGAIGEVAPFTLDTMANHRLVRGIIGATGVKDADGVSPVFNLGPVAADGGIFAIMHVMSAEGTAAPTLDVTVESDADIAFASPINRLTFSQVTTSPTSQLVSLETAITDTHWRVAWDVGGTDPEYDLFVALGVWKNPS